MSTLAVVNQSGESLSFFDASGKKTGQLTGLLSEPHELCFDERTNLLYISHAYKHGWYGAHGDYVQDITVVDASTRKVVGLIDVRPMGGTHYLVIDRERNILYASVEDGLAEGPNRGGIIGIDLATRKVTKTIESGHRTHWFVMTPDGKKAFTCNKEAGYISVIDLLEEKLVGRIDVPGGCEQPGISTDGRLAYFPTPEMSTFLSNPTAEPAVAVVDTVTNEVVRTIPLDNGTASIHVDSQDRVLVGQYHTTTAASGKKTLSGGSLLVLSSAAQGNQKLGEVATGEVPLTIFSSPDGTLAYVASIFRGTVSVIDTAMLTLSKILDIEAVQRADKTVHSSAHGMALIP